MWHVTGRDTDGTSAFVLPQMMKTLLDPIFIQMLKRTFHESPAFPISEKAIAESPAVAMSTTPATPV